MKFTKENTFIRTRKEFTGDIMYDVMVELESGLEVCHSSFYSYDKASQFKNELINKTAE